MAIENDTRLQTIAASIDGAAAILASVADDVADNANATRQLYAVQALLEGLGRDLYATAEARA